jgi:hypothetical protein
MVGGVAQVLEHLPRNHEDLSTRPITDKRRNERIQSKMMRSYPMFMDG